MIDIKKLTDKDRIEIGELLIQKKPHLVERFVKELNAKKSKKINKK